ncbi:hypothetical protein KAR91_17455 [Candidatus Pacearchaeota archaeon]|nr:hypothetical protein [Candidatus Pacearchaeota archaeon]
MTQDEYRKKHYKWLKRARVRANEITLSIASLEDKSDRYMTFMSRLGACLTDLFTQNIYRKSSMMATTEIFFEMLIEDVRKELKRLELCD